MNKVHVKKGDTVVVISGKDKEKKGKVLYVLPKEGRVVVEGVNMVTRHTKPKRMGEEGGRIQKPAPIDASNVMIFSPKANRPVRVGHTIKDGKKVRICKKTGEILD